MEEIITALSGQRRWLFVIARNSSFAYKGQAVDVQQVGRELGVRYVLTGSVRKAANRVRIGAQLIEAATRAHIWADQFEGTLDDIFDVQDQVTRRVIGAIVPKLEDAEIERAKRKVTENLNAYDYYLRALAALHRRTREANEEVVSLIHKAIAVSPGFRFKLTALEPPPPSTTKKPRMDAPTLTEGSLKPRVSRGRPLIWKRTTPSR